MEQRDRILGSMLGLALGDALGAPFEFLRGRNIPDPIPALELPWMGLPPGSTTDDTAMARNLVRSLVERERFDEDDLIRRHVEWIASDPPDVGALTGRVLRRVQRGEEAVAVAREVWEQRGPEVSAGNGSVMYCAPLGLAYANRPAELLELAPRMSALTHYDGRCQTAALAITLTVAALVRGQEPIPTVTEVLSAVEQREGGEELEYLVEVAGGARAIDGPDQGFCLFTAGVAIQALLREGGFETEVRRVVSLGGDTDTNGAVAGSLLGAKGGIEALPLDWLARLAGRDEIWAEAEQLASLADLR
jgi:ADP-ribosyl-[dinitrogen reductase] hydrolase